MPIKILSLHRIYGNIIISFDVIQARKHILKQLTHVSEILAPVRLYYSTSPTQRLP